ncbi:MAG: ATP-binding protein [Spirochaetes bacterium]|nr:ATP-binding protein [Spirochaetota bacterium]
MIELALHILDIAQNSLRAGAGLVEIVVVEDPENDRLAIGVYDNGCGMTPAEIEKALDPFYTTKKVRRIGLGLPMLKQAALQTDGSFSIESEAGKGTRLDVVFRYNHIDRQPLGDIAGALVALILEKPEIDILFTYRKGSYEYVLDTREIREGLDGVPMNNMEVIGLIRANITEGVHSRIS